jgi:nuclear pore complex protein Nup93
LHAYLPLTMDALAGVHQKVKASIVADTTRQMVCDASPAALWCLHLLYLQTLTMLRQKSRSLMIFAGMLKYRMSPDVYSYLARLDVEIAL